jgi:hypothetical protein
MIVAMTALHMKERRMPKPHELRFNAFNMMAPSHNWAGLWSHPRDRSINANTLDYWVDYARTAERGLLDGIFLADVFGVYDVYGCSHRSFPERPAAELHRRPCVGFTSARISSFRPGSVASSRFSFLCPVGFGRIEKRDHLAAIRRQFVGEIQEGAEDHVDADGLIGTHALGDQFGKTEQTGLEAVIGLDQIGLARIRPHPDLLRRRRAGLLHLPG